MDPLTMLTLGIGALKLGIALYGLVASETDSVILKRMKAALAVKEAQLAVEKAKLAAKSAAIDAAPPKTGQDLVDDLNRRFGKKP